MAMEVTMKIEAHQMGETVLDIFKNLSEDDKKSLALDIMREWLKSPEFMESPNYEQLVIDEFRKGIRSAWTGRYNDDTPDDVIRRDHNFEKTVREYRTSKQCMVESIRSEIVEYYNQELSKEIRDSEVITRIKDETFQEIAKRFPDIIQNTLVRVFSDHLLSLKLAIENAGMQAIQANGMTQQILSRLGNNQLKE